MRFHYYSNYKDSTGLSDAEKAITVTPKEMAAVEIRSKLMACFYDGVRHDCPHLTERQAEEVMRHVRAMTEPLMERMDAILNKSQLWNDA